MKPQIHIFFGAMGSGKNYHGQSLAAKLNIPFLDGDTVIPSHDFFIPINAPIVLWLIKKLGYRPFCRSMISDYSRRILGEAIIHKSAGL